MSKLKGTSAKEYEDVKGVLQSQISSLSEKLKKSMASQELVEGTLKSSRERCVCTLTC
jgi:hypothetical protein